LPVEVFARPLLSLSFSFSFFRPPGNGDEVVKRALVTGITGQDGAYLSQLLLTKGYEVFGLVRRSSSGEIATARLRWLGIENEVRFLDGNLTDLSSIIRSIREARPDAIYNLGAQSFVK